VDVDGSEEGCFQHALVCQGQCFLQSIRAKVIITIQHRDECARGCLECTVSRPARPGPVTGFQYGDLARIFSLQVFVFVRAVVRGHHNFGVGLQQDAVDCAVDRCLGLVCRDQHGKNWLGHV
jgi:hypothetical protein